ncbi:hypothetical protein [Streptomyces mobaraensis]|uniref:Uncharacterized protein n=1 Tax=Streptomyces mobaraensis TaxID=35621 RepID=A0A5N5WEH7_STRMB|nr:hypothetical protein [Streptomyces mobaraensis]KAB7850145.1 hypothetical protein FRZ00_05970 [Streptomyces mobaraensis]
MSDAIDGLNRRTIYQLMDAYDLVADVAEKLPTPITLPVALAGTDWSERTAAVAHAVEIAMEIPGASYELREAFQYACLGWYSASIIMTQQMRAPRFAGYKAVQLQIATAEQYAADARRVLDIEG